MLSARRAALKRPSLLQHRQLLLNNKARIIGLTGVLGRRLYSNDVLREFFYNDIKKATEEPDDKRVIVDVREPYEVELGAIPGSINIPLKSSPEALAMSEDDFEDKFGFPKPDPAKEVVFYCRSGVRSTAAAEFAKQQGYKKIGNYKGSWLEWAEKKGIKTS